MGSGVEARMRWTWRGTWRWLAVLNGAIFLLQEAHVGDETLVDLAAPAGEAIDQGEIWRPLSSLLVHPGGLVHLGINTALLAAVGGLAERELGRNKFVVTYFSAGFATNAVRYALGGRTGGGASAAIFAVAGAALASRLHRCGRARESDVAALIASAGGSSIAATASDNHVLALGLGGAIGHAARTSNHHRFAQVAGAVTAAGLGAMVSRILAS